MNIYDCFMYFDEDLLLDLRLNSLDKFVKKFVITEATYTHNGTKKKLNFDISKFKNKDSESMINDLRYAKIFVSQRKEWVRFSPHFYNTLDDIEFVISEIRKKL